MTPHCLGARAGLALRISWVCSHLDIYWDRHLWGVSAQHQMGSGASLDPQSCGSSVINSGLSYLLSDHLIQLRGTISEDRLAYQGFLQSTQVQKYQIIVLPQTKVCCLQEGFAQDNVYSNCSLFFIVLLNYNNKNAYHCFLFSSGLSIVAARAFVQVVSRIAPFFGMLH